MDKRIDTRKLWLVEHPLHQYNEDVKDLARRNHLKIYDTKTGVDFDPSKIANDAPKLTKKGEKKEVKKDPAKQFNPQ